MKKSVKYDAFCFETKPDWELPQIAEDAAVLIGIYDIQHPVSFHTDPEETVLNRFWPDPPK